MEIKNISENTLRSIIRKSLLEKKGLWDNIHAKRKRGEKPAKPRDEDYPDKEAWEKAKKSEGEECSEEMLEEAYELLENGLTFVSEGIKYSLYEIEDFSFIKSSIESASGDKVEQREFDDYDNPLFWSLTNEYVNYYIGSDDDIIKYNAETGERYPIGNLKNYDEPKENLNEAEYRGRKVKLGKIMQGDVKKFKVYVKNDKGNVVKVNFGDPNMRIKKSNPKRRKSFRARHRCDNPGPRWRPRFWACRTW